MSGEVSGPSGTPMIGLVLLEHQQQLAREGRDQRDMTHELGIAAKKVETIYNGLQHAAEEWKRTASYVAVATTAADAVQKQGNAGEETAKSADEAAKSAANS